MALIKRFIRYFKDRKNLARLLKAESFSPFVPLMLLACMFPVVFALIFPFEGDVLAEAKLLAPKLTVEKLHVVDAEVAMKAAPAIRQPAIEDLQREIIDFKMARADSWMFGMAVFMGALTFIGTAVLIVFGAVSLSSLRGVQDIEKQVKIIHDGIVKTRKSVDEQGEYIDEFFQKVSVNVDESGDKGKREVHSLEAKPTAGEHQGAEGGSGLLASVPAQSTFGLEHENPTAPDLQWKLGFKYEVGLNVEQSYVKAFEWYEKSAERGDATGQWRLGSMYASGNGVEQNDRKAFEWHKKSAKQGDATGQWRLGATYDFGKGVEQNDTKAFGWYKKSAEQGSAIGQRRLGYMYELGKSVEQSDDEAFEWYKKSAKQGNTFGQWRLGHMYEFGRSVSQSFVLAWVWYSLSKAQGEIASEKALVKLEKKMTKKLILQAQEEAREIKEKYNL
jgi:TPR repeat protein